MHAYPKAICIWGYITICNNCFSKAKQGRDYDSPVAIANPPAIGKKQRCEHCDKKFVLLGAKPAEIPAAI